MSTQHAQGCPAGDCAIMPLFHLDADWPSDTVDFDFGVSIVRAPARVAEQMTEHILTGLASVKEGDWCLVTRFFSHTYSQSTASSFLHDLARTFLAALNVVKSHGAIARAVFRGEKERNGSLRLDREEHEDNSYESYDSVRAHWPARFHPDDVEVIRKVWSGVVDLAYQKPCDSELDTVHDTGGELGLVWGLAKPSLDEFGNTGDATGWAQTRVGQALATFDVASRTPMLTAFPFMVVVLETLFCLPDDGRDTKSLVCERVAATIGSRYMATDISTRLQVEKIFEVRNRLVHRGALACKQSEKTLKAGFDIVRRSLQAVLVNSQLFKLWTDVDRNETALRRHFLGASGG